MLPMLKSVEFIISHLLQPLIIRIHILIHTRSLINHRVHIKDKGLTNLSPSKGQ